MKKILMINIFVCLVLIFSGCNREYYVDKDSISDICEEARKNKLEVIDNEAYDDEPSKYFYDYASASENYIFYTSFDGSYVLDINNMTYRNMCNVSGCTHTGKACENAMEKCSIRYHKNGLYYLNGSSLYCRTNSGEINKVYTNDFSTEWSKKMDPENPELLTGMIFIDENTLLISGRNYYIKYDLTTGERSEAVVGTEGNILTFCYSDGVIFSSYENGKLVRTVWDTGESEQVSEHGSHVRLVNDRIWYANYSPVGSRIYSNNLGFTDEKLEIENTEVMFDVFDDVVVYTDSYESYYLYNQNGEIRELFHTEELTYFYDKLPQQYQHENGKTEFQVSEISFLYYENRELYLKALYLIEGDKGTEYFCAFYKVDKDGNIIEFRGEMDDIMGD